MPLRIDRDGEFNASSLNAYRTELGPWGARELTASYSPQQNDIVERRNQTLPRGNAPTAEGALHVEGKEPPWQVLGEAIITAVYILSYTSCKGIDGKTPFELWYGRTPVVHHLRVFACIVHVNSRASSTSKTPNCT
jgi:hypothetical protein